VEKHVEREEEDAEEAKWERDAQEGEKEDEEESFLDRDGVESMIDSATHSLTL
jgi:hypothetical protein